MAPKYIKFEIETSRAVDQKLIAAGWAIQNVNRFSLYDALGIAARGIEAELDRIFFGG